MSGEVKAAQAWPSNAEMIRDVASLHLSVDAKSMDVTYGEGVWWKLWKPKRLIKHDLHKGDGVDYRHLPHRSNSFGMIAFDPPYVAQGGRSTSKLDYNDRYGMVGADVPRTPKQLQAYNNEGLAEVYRCLQPGGIALVKSMDYISSGHHQRSCKWTFDYATEVLGFKDRDSFYFVGNVRSQPPTRTIIARGEDGKPILGPDGNRLYRVQAAKQQHARTNLSTLFVFMK